MKKKRLIRIARLLTALIIVMLLNLILMILPDVLKEKNSPDFAGEGKAAEDILPVIPSDSKTGEQPDNPLEISANLAASNEVNSQETAGKLPDFTKDPDFENIQEPTNDISEDSANASESKSDSAGGNQPETAKQLPVFTEEPDFGNSKEPADDRTEDLTNEPENSSDSAFYSDTVTLCLMGDLMCLAGQQYTAERSDGTHDYTGSFYLLRDTFSSFDFVIGNLETTLSESNPYSTKAREVNEQPNCNAPADYLASLKWAGITHLVTANNHSLDGGLVGIEETIAHLDEYGIPHTGTYRPDDTGKRYLMLEKNGIHIALFSFTELINQRELVTKSQLSRIIDSYSRADVKERIAQARADGADFVIVYEHWGSENVHEVRDYQKSHAKEIAEAGADLIIGSHPHCLQRMEYIATQDGRSVPCFYSLGNVVSSMTRDINHDTVFVQVCLARNGQENSEFYDIVAPASEDTKDTPDGTKDTENPAYGRVAISSLTLLPCHVLTAFDGHYRVITPVDYKTQDKSAAAELAAAAERIETHYQRH